MNGELKITWKKAVVSYLIVLSLPAGTEEKT
jgi:hypothetical protein